jgi:26S proteasome regulatory subunit N7
MSNAATRAEEEEDSMDTDAIDKKLAELDESEEKVDQLIELRKLERALTSCEEKGDEEENDRKKRLTAIQEKMKALMKANEMVGAYELLQERFQWARDEKGFNEMVASEKKKVDLIEKKLQDARDNLGDDEVQQAMREIGDLYAKSGNKEKCLEAYAKCVVDGAGATVGQKMEIAFSKARVGIFWDDLRLWKESIEEIKKLLEQPGGADWERKNRLKVYEGLFMCASRDFESASVLFLESLSTFGAYELMSYDEFVFHCVITAVVALPRVELNEKVVQAPEIIRASLSTPGLPDFLNSLQRCEYAKFAQAFPLVLDAVDESPWLSAHSRYFSREARVRAYAQYLQSYRSVSVPSMARAFGVSTAFLDEELSRFIVNGRLNCTIDAVEGVLRTNRPDKKNALYQQFVKDGDALLNRIQKLSRVIDL